MNNIFHYLYFVPDYPTSGWTVTGSAKVCCNISQFCLTSQEAHYVSATETNQLMLFVEVNAVYCDNHTKHINTLCGQNAEF
jgi:hypothetical protein